jgi:hypothetical protein
MPSHSPISTAGRFWLCASLPAWVTVRAILMYQVQLAAGSAWFCAAVPFVLGAILLALAWQSARRCCTRGIKAGEGWPQCLPLGVA